MRPIRTNAGRIDGLLFSAALMCASACACADEISPNQGLLGDWDGLRSRLYQRGIDFQLGYTSELAYNPQGGNRHLARTADQVAVGTTFDLSKLIAWPGGTFQFTITDRNGQNLSDVADLHTLQQVQEIYGRGSTWRWTQFWYDQALFDGKLDLKLGRLGVGEDFMSFSCLFENLSFCGSLPGNIVSTWYNWPVSQWGVRVRANFAPDWYAKIGAYQVNPGYLDTRNSFRLNNPSGTIGALIPAEVGWTPKLGTSGLPGSYRIGIWYDSSDQPDVFLAANNQPLALNPGSSPRIRGSETGGYAMAQQQLTTVRGNRWRGLSLFANFVQADRNTARIDQLISVGIFYTGPFDARPRDDLGFAAGRTHVNGRVADDQALRNAADMESVPLPGSEYPLELYYSINAACRSTPATCGMTLRPNIQYILRPGGTSQNTDVVVIGLKTIFKF
jgi:porin